MQKFTRALTREVVVGEERLAVTLSEAGLSVRVVGMRKPPLELSWAACISAVAGQGATTDPPTPAQIEAALAALKAGKKLDHESTHAVSAPPHPAAPVPPADAVAPVSSTSPSSAHAETSITALLARIERWLASHRPQFQRGLLPGVDPAELGELETSLGKPVPAELAALLHWHNGQDPGTVGAFEESWNLLGAREIVTIKADLDAEPPPGWKTHWLPILDNDNNSYVALDPDEPSHPLIACWHGKDAPQPFAPSLTAWLRDFAANIEHGAYVEDSERGSFLRKAASAK